MALEDDQPDVQALGAELKEARPPPDRIAMERARARAQKSLFGNSEPPRVGRYRIEERLGGGGMGVVYRAHDPELDRNVALKVLQPSRSTDARSRQRLAIEAQTLAKLDHPNVVKVHDVLTVEEQTVVVMELIDGKTLADWQAETVRDWRECIQVYLQAGDGLAAAHGVEVIHRDFKPSNAIIGADGRVRVLDFGLARVDGPEGHNTHPSASVTETGDLVGTLGYASPEQLRGERLTSASDQFSFCVSLHHAIEGVSPFAGASIDARLASIARTPVVGPPNRHVPPWLRAIVARGLSPEPATRYGSLVDLLNELRRPRGWRRWRRPMIGFAIAAASIGITVGLRSDPGPAPQLECDGGANEIAAVWNPRSRQAISDAIDKIGAPYGSDIRDRAFGGLDAYAATWAETHRAACTDTRRGVTSPAILDRRMLCLGQSLGDLRAAVEVLENTDRSSLFATMDVIARLPSVSRCSDLERLEAEVEPPDASIRAGVAVVHAQISHAEALAHAGHSGESQRAARLATESAKKTRYAPVEIDAALAESRILISQGLLPAAEEPLKRAREHALALKLYAPAVEASARLIYVEGMLTSSQAGLERDIAYLVPLASGPECDHFVRPLLLNNIGAAYLASGRRDLALDYFQRAKRDIGGYAPIDLELTVIDRNLAMLTPDHDTRVALAAGVWNRLRATLGDSHPAALEALVVYSEYVADPAVAYDLLERATSDYRRHHRALRRELALAELALGFLARERGNHELATAGYTRAIAAALDTSDADVVIAGHLAAGELAIEARDSRKAIAELTAVSEARLRSTLWYERADGLRAEVDLGIAESAQRHDDAATRHFETAIAGYPSILALNEEVMYRQLAARAKLELGALLRRRDPMRAKVLSDDATGFYRTASAVSYQWLLERGNEGR